MEVCGQLHVPAALLPGGAPGTQLIGDWVGHRASLGAVTVQIKLSL
jgi:hypothetical protein